MDEKIYSVLAIGQSNMAGRGYIEEVPQINNEKCYMLRMGRWQTLSDPVNADRCCDMRADWRSGVGPQSGFADQMNELTGKKIGMIPCADGGTKLCQWMPGEILFDHAAFQAKLAMRTSEFSGIIWHQGESDCPEPHVEDYKEKLIEMLTTLRKELNAVDKPLILGEITEHATEKWNMPVDVVRAMNHAICEAAEIMPNAAVVSVDDLTIQADGIHFDAKSQRILGKRYADAFYEVWRSLS